MLAGAPYADFAAQDGGGVYLFSAPATTGESFCFGDGLGSPCPCDLDNLTQGAAGCRNSGQDLVNSCDAPLDSPLSAYDRSASWEWSRDEEEVPPTRARPAGVSPQA